MTKTYADFMNEITPDELYDRLVQFGLFSEKLPPIFDAADFLAYCKKQGRPAFAQHWYSYASFTSMRNINIPRIIGIPTPMAHERICACLSNQWPNLQTYFQQTTSNQDHIVSRIHIRKMRETDALFEMNYKNWRVDGTPEPDISLGKRYLVKADISKCFPSIYSHAISWALVGKNVAKQNIRNHNLWYNQLDTDVRNSTSGETHGLLIGPHTSNVLSEIILCKVDEALCKNGWKYTRNIDDYLCYVNSREEADQFLLDLNKCLREYGLLLNHKKTEIVELPVGAVEQWVHQIKDRTVYLEKFHSYIDYKEVQSFLDFCIELMARNKDNASILFYGIKTLVHDHTLTENAKEYIAKTFTSLALNFPYIVPILDKYVYEPCKVNKETIRRYLNLIYDKYIEKDYFEAASYALYLATKYDIEIKSFSVNTIISKNDCIMSLCCLIYCRHFHLANDLKILKDYAKGLAKDDGNFEEQWPFAYECLTVGFVKDDWKKLKKDHVSFLKEEYRS